MADALVARGLRPWLDERELVPGRPWQEALEEIIQTAKTAVVAVGPGGLGPWEHPEMRACLSEFVNRKLPVIPLLLPGAPDQPDLLLFLKAFTWVDLRSGLTDDGLDRLFLGITGLKPSSVSSTPARVSALDHILADLAALAKRKPVGWLASLVRDCCSQSSSDIDDGYDFDQLRTCIEEAAQLLMQGAAKAGDPWAKKNSLQAVTLMIVELAHMIARSPNALIVIANVCESMLNDETIKLRISWSAGAKDELYNLAVETNDPHDDDVYRMLDRICQR